MLRDQEIAQVLEVCCEGVEQQQRQEPCAATQQGCLSLALQLAFQAQNSGG
jgi:hypothetical protein